MAQRVPSQLSTVTAQSALPKTQRGQVDNTSQLQFQLIQKNGSSNADFASLRSDSQVARVPNSAAVRNGINVSAVAQPTSDRNSAAAVTSMNSAQQFSISIDDSMLLNLLKQIVDSEFTKSRSAVASHDNSVQDAEMQIKRDAVFGVLRSALDVAQHSGQDSLDIQSKPELEEVAKADNAKESVQTAAVAPRAESKEAFSILVQEASRLASVVKRMSPTSAKKANFIMQNWIRVEKINEQSTVWRFAQLGGQTAQNDRHSRKVVVGEHVVSSIQENEYGTAPLWYQQDMENGPPQIPISPIERTWRVINNPE